MDPVRIPQHVEHAAVALDGVRLLYVPVPKAASTAILWGLAKCDGLSEEAFVGSTKLEVTRALTVHDVTRWGNERRLRGRSESDRDSILRSDTWLRFTVIREPVRRLWSVWVTKILVRDPRFVAMFGGEPWFPTTLRAPEDVIKGFRRFVAVLPTRPASWHDPHWSAQCDLIGVGDVDYHVIGRVENLDAALARVNEHVRRQESPALDFERENASLLPFSPGLLDQRTADACAEWTARDRDVFGYVQFEHREDIDQTWLDGVQAVLPAIRAIAERNERISDLRSLLMHSRAS